MKTITTEIFESGNIVVILSVTGPENRYQDMLTMSWILIEVLANHRFPINKQRKVYEKKNNTNKSVSFGRL